ncbi:hypothetical protein BBJ29_007212 [Phytophthora kernoviae]|uniref:Uncharacterized protein n=1 Tax=Phytophthora kernoviae TaxID=325452 RepID=A0A3F2RFE4_9STRA|nr:hypothetical protein BBP00_00008586 [Phytophthora kernoviae]RLN60068.1 hypothetical protein BBJ29_007212 [Phytophthora kernoviae]
MSAEGCRYEMDSGDYFSERFTVTQFEDIKSVKQIFDLLLFYFCNIEISISKKIGHITVREDGDNGSKNISVSTMDNGTKMESNTITFSEFYDHNKEKNKSGYGDFGIRLGTTGAAVAMRGQEQDWEENKSHSDQWEGSAQSTIEEEEAPVVKRKKKRGYRKATHTIRKEETERLRVELARLEAQMAELQRRAFAPNCDQDGTEDKCLYEKFLRHAVRKQQETFVEVQSVMTDFASCNIQAGSPIQREINLPRDDTSRRNALRAMKSLKLQDAREFFGRRLSHLSPLKSMSEDYRFENDEGDYWAVRFATSQFESAKSVKQVFDLVVYYLCNIEISVSEKMGHLTVREDDDNGEPGITHNRLVSVTGKGLRMESNAIVFSEYHEAEAGEQGGYGMIVVDFADEDKRYPYRPNERIRKDVNTVMEVRSVDDCRIGTSMRLHYFLLVAAATLLASTNVVSASIDSAQLATTTATDSAPAARSLAKGLNEGNGKRSLRTAKTVDDDDADEDDDDDDDDDDKDEEERVSTAKLLIYLDRDDFAFAKFKKWSNRKNPFTPNDFYSTYVNANEKWRPIYNKYYNWYKTAGY